MSNNYIKKGSIKYWRAIASLFLGSMVAFGAEYCVQPIIPVLADAFDLSPAVASLAMSFGTVGMAVSMLCIAGIAKRLNRKITMTVALVVSSAFAIGIALSNNFELILLLRLLQGFLLAGFPALALTYVNEEFDPKIIGLVVGIYVSGTTIGGLAGRLGISVFTDLFSWRIGVGGAGIIYLAMSILFYFGLPKSENKPDGKKEPMNVVANIKKAVGNKKLMAIYIIAFALLGGFTCIYNYITYVLLAAPYNLSQTVIGFIFLMYIFGTFGSTMLGGLSDKYGNGRILCFGIMLMIVGVTLTLAEFLLIKILGLAVLTFGFFGSHSTACGWAGKTAAKEIKAQASSLYMFFYYLGGSFIGTLGGSFLTSYGWTGIVLLVLLVLSGALAIAMQLTFMQLPVQRTAKIGKIQEIR